MVEIVDLMQQYPRVSIVIIGLVVSFVISLVNYFVMDKDKMKEIKSKQKSIQEEIKKHQKAGNHEKMMELNKEMMTHTMEMMKHSFKPMLITFVPIILFFGFIRGVFAGTSLGKRWIWYYLVSAFTSSMIFRKVFKLP